MQFPLTDIVVYLVLLVGAILSYRLKKLTLYGAVTGLCVGALIYLGVGVMGILMLALFFVAGSVATGWQAKRKVALGMDEKESGQRTAGQVLANGGVAALLGAAAYLIPSNQLLFQLMLAGSLASAMADTLSSELGTIYGSRFFNVISFKKDQRGLDGVISLEGTLIGVCGAALIAAIYCFTMGWSINFVWILLAGFIGNLADSVLGATLERKGIIGNDLVNGLNTAFGALVCGLLYQI